MKISIIVAAAENGVIGRRNKIPWHMPAELAYFKKITMGHPIIMGRKTHESIGRTLPGRYNIVITTNINYKPAGGSKVVTSLNEGLELVKCDEEVFIIGGGSIYEQAMPLADRIYLTKVQAKIDGDIFFTYNPAEWREISSEHHDADSQNQYAYDFVILEH